MGGERKGDGTEGKGREGKESRDTPLHQFLRMPLG